ncbi:MAG: glycosyltransferase family 4 protein [Dysgonamonadaceae bacterium]|nr:glycosyltransferase family 4 protein [Dysgonamonadaceae bacterium]
MKILYLLPGGLYNPAGMERVTTIKANYLAEKCNYDVSIVTTEQLGRPVFYPLSEKVHLYHLDIGIGKNFDTESYFQKIVTRFFKIKAYKKKLGKLLFEIKPDITISTLSGLDIEFINQLKDGSIKIGELHFPGDFRKLMTQKLYTSYVPNLIGKLINYNFKRKCRKLSRLVVLTEEERSYWKNTPNIVVIPNPLPFYPQVTSSLENKKTIAVGRLAFEKGFDLLIEAWKAVYEKHPDWKLTILGKGNQKEVLSQLILNKGLDSVIEIQAPVADIEHVYPAYSLLVFPSRYLDSFGMVIVEGMSFGLPPVAFDAPCGPKDIITDGVNGFLVQTGDTATLSVKINQLIESVDLRTAMSKAARERAKDFEVDKIMEHWVCLFNELKDENNRCIRG